jgi:hypothetical protein
MRNAALIRARIQKNGAQRANPHLSNELPSMEVAADAIADTG